MDILKLMYWCSPLIAIAAMFAWIKLIKPLILIHKNKEVQKDGVLTVRTSAIRNPFTLCRIILKENSKKEKNEALERLRIIDPITHKKMLQRI